jgi:hypothetical protein
MTATEVRLVRRLDELETRVAKLERREMAGRAWCEPCYASTQHVVRCEGVCIHCERNLCASCAGASCPNSYATHVLRR